MRSRLMKIADSGFSGTRIVLYVIINFLRCHTLIHCVNLHDFIHRLSQQLESLI